MTVFCVRNTSLFTPSLLLNMTTDHAFTSRSNEVNLLLKSAITKKLLKDYEACHQQAETDLQQAYNLAHEEPRLPTPWPEITSYRLAHLRMRTARTEQELQAVAVLFAEAERNGKPLLGILPNIYRLAIQMRLGEKNEAFFTEIVKSLDSYQHSSDRPKKLNTAQFLNNEMVNYLELLAYVGGFDYRSLEGRYTQEDPFMELGLGESGYTVKSNHIPLPKIQMPHSLALTQALDMAGEEGLVFEWPNAPITNSYHYYHHSLQTPTHDMKTWSELLFKMITEGKLLKNNIQDDCRRQQLKQIKKFLASTLGVDKKTIFADTATEKTLSPQLKVFAVIKHTTKQLSHKRTVVTTLSQHLD